MKEKVDVRWLHHGDKCSAYFYHKVKLINSFYSITSLKVNGQWISDRDELKQNIMDFYKGLYAKVDSSIYVGWIEEVISSSVLVKENKKLYDCLLWKKSRRLYSL